MLGRYIKLILLTQNPSKPVSSGTAAAQLMEETSHVSLKQCRVSMKCKYYIVNPFYQFDDHFRFLQYFDSYRVAPWCTSHSSTIIYHI